MRKLFSLLLFVSFASPAFAEAASFNKEVTYDCNPKDIYSHTPTPGEVHTVTLSADQSAARIEVRSLTQSATLLRSYSLVFHSQSNVMTYSMVSKSGVRAQFTLATYSERNLGVLSYNNGNPIFCERVER